MKHKLILVAAVAALAGCAEETQTIKSGARPDTPAFQGTGMPYADAGWKQGDKTSWEQHLKTRLQQGQNDYTRVN